MKSLYLILVLTLLLAAVACGGSANEARPATPTRAIASETEVASVSTRAPATQRPVTSTRPAQINGLSTIALSELPEQAHETLDLIERGGPFPYRQDGGVFQNRERLLSRKPGRCYHEFTVDTPGSDDRGARRIITGEAGELYYTDDHYVSFKVILINE